MPPCLVYRTHLQWMLNEIEFMSTENTNTIKEIPVLPLRDVVVYPHMVIPLFVGREVSTSALEEAMRDKNKSFY